MMPFHHWKNLVRWTYAGVDYNLSGNGGLDCVNFIPPWQKVTETVIWLLIALCLLLYALPKISLPKVVPRSNLGYDRFGKRLLLAILCLVYGMELGFKFASKQMVWILNPCHLLTMIQIYLLVAPPNRFTTAIFRIHLHCLSGAMLAIILPVVNTRMFPFEIETYYIQHFLLLVVPYYLIRLEGTYTVEPMLDFSWALFALCILFIYHWFFLQLLSIATHVNLNNMLCPAISDPFYGRWYRMYGSAHQTALILLHGKVYTYFVTSYLRQGNRIQDECYVLSGNERIFRKDK